MAPITSNRFFAPAFKLKDIFFSLKTTAKLVLLVFAAVLCSCNNSEDPESPGDIENLEGPALTYRNHCGGCHGQDLGSFVERDWTYGNAMEDIIQSITDGYTANGMPAYGSALSAQAIEELTNYILTEIDGKTKAMLEEENPDLSGLITSDDLSFRLETLTDDIPGIPWGIAQLPTGEILVTERGGGLYMVNNDKQLTEIGGIPDVASLGQGGLLDVQIHPDFENNSLVYLSYSRANPDNSSERTTAVARGRLEGNSLVDVENIFAAIPYVNSGNHYGSRLEFDNNGYLYVSVGDRGFRDVYPQELDNAIGKIHRIHDDGQIPTDNPFYNTSGAVASIFTYGTRNPQGMTRHPETGAIWEGEHGPQGGDEINILEAGNNNGWPVISYGINYDGTTFTDLTELDGMEQPVYYWTPSIAPCGMTFVSSEFYGDWENDLFVASLKFEYLHRLQMNGNEVVGHERLVEGIGRVRDAEMGLDGYLYIAVEGPGRLIRLVPEQ
ncbi:PQQ-dependent sugar dehydrogenase [Flagellimonas myxillae]|uniref:PQQ-dependent sugar dehydrogenase n=1 Tax=Flagellimonas myxillae TaxID=2942214 RepID=UPI00201F7E14|nr:PQQ-dependent sugar dehydrogenase [Muricauda myxillae]MCL6265974.1 PQQ-dependent sugar dehydrogenase [Muricauda myxillae]